MPNTNAGFFLFFVFLVLQHLRSKQRTGDTHEIYLLDKMLILTFNNCDIYMFSKLVVSNTSGIKQYPCFRQHTFNT